MARPIQPWDQQPTPGNGGTSRRPWRRWFGYAIGLALLAGALWAVRSQHDPLEQAIQAARTGRLWLVAAAVGLPLLNWLFTSGVFYFLMLSTPAGATANGRAVPSRVSFGEMSLLIGSAWLFNYLPMSPGMFGRIAYHKTVHRIPVHVSVRALFAAMGLGVIAIIAALCMAMLGPKGVSTSTYAAALAAPPLVLAAIAWLMWRCRVGGTSWRQVAACSLRYLDVMVWVAAHYAAVFALIGRPLSLPGAVAIAAVSQAAMQVPLVGNGLGIREWAVGLVGPALPAWMLLPREAGLTQGVGLSADLINRGLELVAAIPVGVVCTALLARRGASRVPFSRMDTDPEVAPQADPKDRRSRKGY